MTKCPLNNFENCIGKECEWWISIPKAGAHCAIHMIAYAQTILWNLELDKFELEEKS